MDGNAGSGLSLLILRLLVIVTAYAGIFFPLPLLSFSVTQKWYIATASFCLISNASAVA